MHYLKYFAVPIILGIFIISCEKDDNTVIDPILNIPSISNATFAPSSFDSDTINAVATIEVHSVDPLNQVSVTLINPLNTNEQIFMLKDDGVSPDSAAGDGKYSGRVFFVQLCRRVGNWKAEFIAEANSGLLSSVIQVNFSVIRTFNNKPQLSNLIAPDSLRRPSGNGGDTVNYAFLQIKATDPDGNCDILRTYFNSYNPNGYPNQFNPFQMYDDGNITQHGDTTAGDNKYSLIVEIKSNPSDTSIGNFTFKFNADDRFTPPGVSDTTYKIIRIYR